MFKSFFTSLLFLSLLASPCFVMAEKAPFPRFVSKYLLAKRLHIYAGIDPERTRHQLISDIFISSTFNYGAAYHFPFGEHWSAGAEVWFNQYATPRLTRIREIKTELDAARIAVYDTASVIRMAGYYAGATLTRQLPHGFSITGGAGCGFYKKGIAEYSTRLTDVSGTVMRSTSSGYDGNRDLPDWFDGVQPGIKLRVEKTLLQRLVVGASVQQSLKDMTKFSEGNKNLSTNFLVHVGVRI